MWTGLLSLAIAAPFHVVEVHDQRGDPVPCATLTSTGQVTWTTDRHGRVAWHEPGLMDRPVWLVVSGEGLSAPLDWLGVAGQQVVTTPGERSILEVTVTGRRPPCAADDRQTRLIAHGVPSPDELHAVQVIDPASGRPVPVAWVEIGDQRAWTDNGGLVTFFDPDDMSSPHDLRAGSHGHETVVGALIPTPGATTTLPLPRTQLAERLHRVTGAGRWEATARLGLLPPAAEPLVNGGVVGQDSALAVPWREGLLWLWGDTNRVEYALGNFQTTGATSALPAVDPERWIDLQYQTDEGFVRGMAPPVETGMTWMNGLAVVEDRAVATFVNLEGDWVPITEGIATLSDPSGRFETLVTWEDTAPIQPDGTALIAEDASGQPWLLFRNGVRMPARLDAIADRATWQAWSPLVADGGGWRVERRDGAAAYAWRTSPAPDARRSDAGELPWEDSPWRSWDAARDEAVTLHNGAVAWSAWRGRYTHIYTQNTGKTSWIGEQWYAESDTPLGPWSWSRHVVTHDDYSLYNPYIHPWFAGQGGRRLLFEGTLTAWLATDDPIPRHDYNQLMFGLQLDDPRVVVPVPLYLVDGRPVPAREVPTGASLLIDSHAPDLPGLGLLPLRWTDCARSDLAFDGAGEVAMWASPPGQPLPGQVPLHRWRRPDGRPAWSAREQPGWTREAAIASVWPARWEPEVPVGDWPAPDRADAGPDRCGLAAAPTLTGRATLTHGPGGTRWTWEGGQADGAEIAPGLAPGTHVLTFTASDAWGLELSDRVVVEIGPDAAEAPSPPPATDTGCGCNSAATGWWMVWVWGRRSTHRIAVAPVRASRTTTEFTAPSSHADRTRQHA